MTWLSDKIESLDDPGAPTTPTRALDTPFAPSATRHTMVMYTIQLACDDGETAGVELRSDSANPPTTVRASASWAPSDPGTGTPAGTVRQQLTYVVPPTHFVSLVSSGTGVATIAHQTEMAIS